MRFAPTTVLDAGCGTGRVARELARRGIDVVGVDVDTAMLATARTKAPELTWIEHDLATLDLTALHLSKVDHVHHRGSAIGVCFDVVVQAGNVMIFLTPGTEGAVLARLAAHLNPGGHLIAGFQLQQGRLDLATYDAYAAAADLELVARWSTWAGDPFVAGGADYAVSVHRRRLS